MLHLVIASCALISCHIFSMQKQQPLPTLPKDMREYIFSFRETDCKEYKASQKKCEWPSTISPQLVKAYYVYDPLERDLTNPIPGESVLPSLSIWPTKDICQCRFAESTKRTDNTFFYYQNLHGLNLYPMV